MIQMRHSSLILWTVNTSSFVQSNSGGSAIKFHLQPLNGSQCIFSRDIVKVSFVLMSVKASPLYFSININFEASLFEVIKCFYQSSTQKWKILSGPVGVSFMEPMSTPKFSNPGSNLSSSSPHNSFFPLYSISSNAYRLILSLFNLWVVEIIDSLSVFTPLILACWTYLMHFVTSHTHSQAPIPNPVKLTLR